MPDSDRYLRGRHAVVTGGSRGIGAAVAAALAARGARLTLIARSAAALDGAADALRRDMAAEVDVLVCDVTDEGAVAEAFARAVDERGAVHVLVNNAGAAEGAPFASSTRALWDRMLAVNLTATYSCTAQVIPAMRAAGAGRIVNIASTAGLRGYKTMTAYCAAKHGVVGLTRALALEMARHGVTVNAVCPGYTDTELTDGSVATLSSALDISPEQARAMLVRTVPRGQLTMPEEVASAVAWLCAPTAAAVTGIALPVAGGEVP
ncbi:MAG: SDR family NAD(P)-dependent oxidoreductase [Gemmatimonadaceae bacterium]